MSSHRLLHRVASLLAAAALVVAPLRATIACDMGPRTEAAASTAEDVAAPVDHTMHADHHGQDTDAPTPLDSPGHELPCDDWASCAMIALPPIGTSRALRSVPPVAPYATIAAAPDAPTTAVEPPPPRA